MAPGIDDPATSTPTKPAVRLAAGDDASGMAVMLGDLLADNLRDYPTRSRVARSVRGPVVMTAADHDRSITVRFNGPEIVIEEGATPGAASMAGPWLDLAAICSGGLSPMQAMREKQIEVNNMRRADLLAAAGYVMSVPASYYRDDDETERIRKQRMTIAAVVVTILVVLVLIRMFRSDGA